MLGLRRIQTLANSIQLVTAPFQTKIKKVIYQASQDIYDTLEQAWSGIKSVYHSEYAKEILYQNILQGWQGFSRVADPNFITALIRSKHIRQVLKHSVPTNIFWYLGTVLISELTLRQIFEEDDSWSKIIINNLLYIYLIRLYLHIAIDNFSYNLCIAEATIRDNLIIENDKICACRQTAKLRANLASAFYYIGNVKAVDIVSIFFGKYVGVCFRTLLYGQSLVEYKLAAIGMCTKHRYQVLTQNNAYAFGMGLSFFLLLLLSDLLLTSTIGIGIDNPFVYDALFCVLYQHYIMISLLIDKPLPGTETGRDFFYYSRLVMESIMRKTWDAIYLMLDFSNQPEKKDDLLKKVNALIKFPPTRLMRKFFLDNYLSSLDDFVKRPAIKLYLDFHGKKIQQIISWIIAQRNDGYMKSISYFTGYAPNFLVSPSEKKMIVFLFEEKLENILNELNAFFKKVVLIQEAAVVNAGKENEFNIALSLQEDYSTFKKENVGKNMEEDFEIIIDQAPICGSDLQMNSLFSMNKATHFSPSNLMQVQQKKR